MVWALVLSGCLRMGTYKVESDDASVGDAVGDLSHDGAPSPEGAPDVTRPAADLALDLPPPDFPPAMDSTPASDHPDLSVAPDIGQAPDLAPAPDVAPTPDLAPAPDLLPAPDLVAPDTGCQPPAGWWNASFKQRLALTVKETTGSLPAGYSVKVVVDTQSLVSAGEMLSSGDDLRVVWSGGAAPVEIDRRLIDMGTATTEVPCP